MARRFVLTALLVYGAVGLVIYSLRPGDLAGYSDVGTALLEGSHPYRDVAAGINTWPPLFSLLCVPLALLDSISPRGVRVVWLLISYAATLLSLHMIVQLLYGKPLRFSAWPHDGVSLADPRAFVPLLLTGRWIISNFEHLQVNLLIFLAALGGLFLVSKGRELAGGVSIGLGVAIKLVPAALIPYLLFRRRFAPALVATVSAMLLGLTPILVFGPARFSDYLVAWQGQLQRGWGVGSMNHSIAAMLDRWIGHGLAPLSPAVTGTLQASGSIAVTGAYVLVLIGLLVVCVRASRGAAALDSQAALAEWSMVLLAAILLAPVTWQAYFAVLLLPNALLYQLWRTAPPGTRVRRLATAGMAVPFTAAIATSPEVLGDKPAEVLEMSSALTLSALFMLAVLVLLRRNCDTGSVVSGVR